MPIVKKKRRLLNDELTEAIRLHDEEKLTWEEVGKKLDRHPTFLIDKANKYKKQFSNTFEFELDDGPLGEYPIDIWEPFDFDWDEAKALFKDDFSAEKWIRDRRWAENKQCVYCGESENVELNFSNREPYYCGNCNQYFTMKTNTAMHLSSDGESSWMLVTYLTAKNSSVRYIAKTLKMQIGTLRIMRAKIKHSWSVGLQPYEVGSKVEIADILGGVAMSSKESSGNVVVGLDTLLETLMARWEEVSEDARVAKEKYDQSLEVVTQIEGEIATVEAAMKIFEQYK